MEELTRIPDGFLHDAQSAAEAETRDGGVDVFKALEAEHARTRRQADRLSFDVAHKAEQGSAADQQRRYLRRREAALKTALDHLAAGMSDQEREAAGIDEKVYPRPPCEVTANPNSPDMEAPRNPRRFVVEPRPESDAPRRHMRLGVVPVLLLFAGAVTAVKTSRIDLPILGWTANHAQLTPEFSEQAKASERVRRMLHPDLNTPVNLDGVVVLYPPFVTRLFRDFGERTGIGSRRLPTSADITEALKNQPQHNDAADDVLFEVVRGTVSEKFRQWASAAPALIDVEMTSSVEFDRRRIFITRRDLERFFHSEKRADGDETEKSRLLRAVSAACRDVLPPTGEPANYSAVPLEYDHLGGFSQVGFRLGYLPRLGTSRISP